MMGQTRLLLSARRRSLLREGLLSVLGAVGSLGCLDRPVVPQEPTTNNIFVEQVVSSDIDKIDVLFVIDNSVSMADKQELLKVAVPVMVRRLVTPDCVNAAKQRARPVENGCPQGYAPEFEPINDIHLGVITSSLGDFGALEQCTTGEAVDKSLLVPKVRVDLPDPDNVGFLRWQGNGQSVKDLEDDFADQVGGAGENGCGFEAPLEAWYRFLVDASPPLEVVLEGDQTVSTGVAQEILDQRAEFLRSDSLVAIVLLTDENDCSGMEGGSQRLYPNAGYGYLMARTKNSPMRVASSQCAENPNDPCCFACIERAVPEGCEDTCPAQAPPPALLEEEDRANTRCFNNKQRFGIDLLYPTQRYVDGLSKSMIVDSRTGELVENPLLKGRRPDLVFFAGILGVPWQDIATDESLADPTSLQYLSATALNEYDERIDGNRWDLILGRPGLSAEEPACRSAEPPEACGIKPVPPKDPFMVEQMQPRVGANPLTGEAVVQRGQSGAWSVVNGHEYDNSVLDAGGKPFNDDLQYSCIFPLAAPIDCTTSGGCDCQARDLPKDSPLCKASRDAASPVGTSQHFGKAYPATRILRVLRDFGDNSIVGSICPKLLDDRNAPDFGYNPAINAIVDRLAGKLGGQCLPRELSVTGEDGVPCTVIEAVPGALSCDPTRGRSEVSAKTVPAVLKQLKAAGLCAPRSAGNEHVAACEEFSMCEIRELTEMTAQQECFGVGNVAAGSQAGGFCYIDPAKGPDAGGLGTNCLPGDEASWVNCTNPHVDRCGATQQRMLRFVGKQTPAPNSVTFVACAGEAASDR